MCIKLVTYQKENIITPTFRNVAFCVAPSLQGWSHKFPQPLFYKMNSLTLWYYWLLQIRFNNSKKNHNTSIFHPYCFCKVHFLVLTSFRHLSLNSFLRNGKSEQKQFFLSLSLKNKLWEKNMLHYPRVTVTIMKCTRRITILVHLLTHWGQGF